MKIEIKSGWLGRNTLDWYSNEDGLGEHIIYLVEYLKNIGHEVGFSGDEFRIRDPDLEIHLERQLPSSRRSKKILIKSEPSFVQPQNRMPTDFLYKKILDWRTDTINNSKYVHYNYARDLRLAERMTWSDKTEFIVCIAGNKNAVLSSPESLYGIRTKFIRILDERLGTSFGLYGSGWDLKDHPVGLVAKIMRKIFPKIISRKRTRPLTSYRGFCDRKDSVMRRAKFCLCIENVHAPGAVSEKLIDCFSSRTIPLYLGATDIEKIIDPRLIIDLRKFPDADALINHMNRIDSKWFEEWQDMLEYSANHISHEFSLQSFVEKVAKNLAVI